MSQAERPTPIIDVLFPGRRVHLIGGASGAGKTTWLLQTLEQWRQSKPVFGYQSHPCSFAWISYDRDFEDFEETCERMHIDPTTYNFNAPSGSDFKLPLLSYLETFVARNKGVKLLIIEGLSNRTPLGKMNDPVVVGSWLREIQFFCRKHDLTIIGVIHAPKMKERDRYKEPRSRLAGCASWPGYSSTAVIIEEKNADGESELRELFILPRNARKHKYNLDFKDGLLVEVVQGNTNTEKFEYWYTQQEDGGAVDLQAILAATSISRSRLSEIIQTSINAGRLKRTTPGNFQIVKVSVPN